MKYILTFIAVLFLSASSYAQSESITVIPVDPVTKTLVLGDNKTDSIAKAFLLWYINQDIGMLRVFKRDTAIPYFYDIKNDPFLGAPMSEWVDSLKWYPQRIYMDLIDNLRDFLIVSKNDPNIEALRKTAKTIGVECGSMLEEIQSRPKKK